MASKAWLGRRPDGLVRHDFEFILTSELPLTELGFGWELERPQFTLQILHLGEPAMEFVASEALIHGPGGVAAVARMVDLANRAAELEREVAEMRAAAARHPALEDPPVVE